MTTSLGDRVRSLRLPPQQKSKGVGGWLPWALCALLAVGCGVLGYLAFVNYGAGGAAKSDSEVAKNDKENKFAAASSPAATTSVGAIALESKGYIIPVSRILVSPQVSGLLEELNIEEGAVVKKGTTLGVIQRDEYQQEVDRTQGARDAAFWRHKEALNGPRDKERKQADEELAEWKKQQVQYTADLARATELVKSNAITQQEYDATKARYEMVEKRISRLAYAVDLMQEGTREERINVAQAELKEAEAELARAKWRLGKCKIEAPIEGTILKKNTEEGNIVNAVAFNGSYSICEMADLTNLEVDMNIQERDVSKVFKGQKCEVRAEAYPNRVYQGVVSRLMPIADRAKGAIPVRVKVTVPTEEQGQFLKPDMGAIVAFRNDPVPGDAKNKPIAP